MLQITRCGIHGFHETLGIDTNEIRFYWTLESEDENAAQTAYQIRVLELSAKGQEAGSSRVVAWDSGKQESLSQRDVVCKPADGFRSTQAYTWQVTVWDQEGIQTTSTENQFFTAYPNSSLLPPLSMNQTYMPHTALIFRTWFEDMDNKWKAWWIGDGYVEGNYHPKVAQDEGAELRGYRSRQALKICFWSMAVQCRIYE